MIQGKSLTFLSMVSILDIKQNNGYIPDNDDAYLIKSDHNKTVTVIGERQKDDRY